MTAQEEILAKYGQPGSAYQSKFCELWNIQTDLPWFPAKRIFINKDFKVKLMTALVAIEFAGLQNEIQTFDGCYVERKVRGSNKISLHSWALSIDLNAHKEKLGQTFTHWSDKFLQIMRDSGIYPGWDFKGRKDPMHFGAFNG